MGYPMTYGRVIGRNCLNGGYDDHSPANESWMIRGDLRRMERDALDGDYGSNIAEAAGVTKEQAESVLKVFFLGADYDTRTGKYCGWQKPPADFLRPPWPDMKKKAEGAT